VLLAVTTCNPAFCQTNAIPALNTNIVVRSGPFDESADAHKDIHRALAQAKSDAKLVLLDFGANWCPDCVALSRLFDHQLVKPFLEANFLLLKINVGRKDRNQDLCRQYDAPVTKGIPAIVVLDATGQVLAATHNGELANARTATGSDILAHLKRWQALKSAR
jgi:thiol:disulfide interchange protein